MLTQRVIITDQGSKGQLYITCEAGGLAELLALADELELRSTITTEGTIHHLNDPAGNGPHGAPHLP